MGERSYRVSGRFGFYYGSARQEDPASGKSRYVLGCKEDRRSE